MLQMIIYLGSRASIRCRHIYPITFLPFIISFVVLHLMNSNQIIHIKSRSTMIPCRVKQLDKEAVVYNVRMSCFANLISLFRQDSQIAPHFFSCESKRDSQYNVVIF